MAQHMLLKIVSENNLRFRRCFEASIMNFIINFLHKTVFKRPESSRNTFPLKHEIFESRFLTQIRSVRVDDLGTGEKK
jgi:hypothetical protein